MIKILIVAFTIVAFSIASFADVTDQNIDQYINSNPGLKPYSQKYIDLLISTYRQKYASNVEMQPCMDVYAQMIQAGYQDAHFAIANDIKKAFTPSEIASLTAFHNDSQKTVSNDLLTKENNFDASKGKDYYRSVWNGQNTKDFFSKQNNPQCMKLIAGNVAAK